MTNKANMGKWAEKQVALFLEQCSNGSSSFAWHRLPDARSARGMLAAQPSDMIVSLGTKHGNRTIYLEVKETKDIRRLQKAKIGQYGMLLKFWLTQAHVLVLVFMSTTQQWVMLKGGDLFSLEECPPSFPLWGRQTYDTAADALSAYFKELM